MQWRERLAGEMRQAHGSVVEIVHDEPRPSLLRVGREEIVGTELHAAQCVAASVPDRVHLQGGGVMVIVTKEKIETWVRSRDG